MQKTIFISLAFPMSARNLLRNPLYEYLSSRYRIVIISEMSNQKEFIREFKKTNTYFENLIFDDKNTRNSLIFRLHRWGDRYFFANNRQMHGVPLNKYLYKAKWLNELKTKVAGEIFVKFPRLNKWMSCKIEKMLVSDYYNQLFDKYRPCLVFTSHPFTEAENQIVYNAKRRGIASISIIHSWDNLTGKGRMHNVPDKVVVWNDIMKEEMETLYRDQIRKEDIHVVGMPQHDYLFNEHWEQDREAFLKTIGASPNRAVITYISRGLIYPHYRERENLDTIIDALKYNKFEIDAQLIIREIAGTVRSLCKDVIGPKPNVIYDIPDVSHRPSSSNNNVWNSDPSSTYQLGNLMKHSDVILNFGSTITLDSIYFDKPNIWPIYPPEKKYSKIKYGNVPNALKWCNLQPMLRTNGIDIPKKPEDLIDLINIALTNPKKLSSQRSEIKFKYCPFRDGRAGLRIAEVIDGMLN
jgi:hypothetical protein